MKKFAVYSTNDIDALKSFLIQQLNLTWSGDKFPPMTKYARIVFLSGLKITWVHASKLPEEFTLLEYKRDKAKFLHVLKKMYKNKISIPDNTLIYLSDERIELIKDMLDYYEETYQWQDSSKITVLEHIVDNGCYEYKHSNMLNELVNEYNNQTDKPEPLAGVAGKSKKLDLDIDTLMEKVSDGTLNPSTDTFQKLLDELRKQREKDKEDKRKSNPWIADKPPQKYWDDAMYDIHADAANVEVEWGDINEDENGNDFKEAWDDTTQTSDGRDDADNDKKEPWIDLDKWKMW